MKPRFEGNFSGGWTRIGPRLQIFLLETVPLFRRCAIELFIGDALADKSALPESVRLALAAVRARHGAEAVSLKPNAAATCLKIVVSW